MSALAIGDAIPAAKLIDADGATIDLAGLKGAPLVVYFYPKADTPGCTVEAQDFTRLAPEFAHLGAHVIAVSRDEIGRASCRERVCQDVELSVVAVSIKKKTNTTLIHDCLFIRINDQ